MANTTQFSGVDINNIVADAQAQFRGLNLNEPGQWPVLPKLAAFLLALVATVVLGWVLLLNETNQELQASIDQEPVLKQDYRNKLVQAINLGELRKQKIQVEEYVNQLEKQLPGKAEMDALLSDINQAGLGRGLQFELFKPGQVVVKDYYAELPISIRVSGRYHDVGSFAADVANLSRIVTLHNLVITATTTGKDVTGALAMDATARTYRYLDQNEIDALRQAAADKRKAGGNK